MPLVILATTKDFVWICHLKVVSRLEKNPNVSIPTLEISVFLVKDKSEPKSE